MPVGTSTKSFNELILGKTSIVVLKVSGSNFEDPPESILEILSEIFISSKQIMIGVDVGLNVFFQVRVFFYAGLTCRHDGPALRLIVSKVSEFLLKNSENG